MRSGTFGLRQGMVTVLVLGGTDFLLKYRGSILGYLWSLVNPIVKFLVILAVFGPYVRASVPQYPLYLFLGIILWEHFAATTTGCMTMLMDKSPIIRHLQFPRILLILGVGCTNLIVVTTHLVIFLLIAWAMGAARTWSVCYLFITGLEISLLAPGVGMFLSSFSLKYRDIPHLWDVCTQVLFWLTPVLYPLHENVPVLARFAAILRRGMGGSPLRWLTTFVEMQPLSIVMHDARRAVLYPVLYGVPSPVHTAGVILACAALFLLGLVLFQHRSPFFPQEY